MTTGACIRATNTYAPVSIIRSAPAHRLTGLAGAPAALAILAARDWRGNGRKANLWPRGHSTKEPSYG
jgi:hypothetical protein